MDGLILRFKGARVQMMVSRCLPLRLAKADLSGLALPADLLRSAASSWKARSEKHSVFAPISARALKATRSVSLF